MPTTKNDFLRVPGASSSEKFCRHGDAFLAIIVKYANQMGHTSQYFTDLDQMRGKDNQEGSKAGKSKAESRPREKTFIPAKTGRSKVRSMKDL